MTQWCSSALGPQSIGYRWSRRTPAVKTGMKEPAGPFIFMARVRAADVPIQRVRTLGPLSPSRQRADSNSDSNRGEPLWSTARCGVEGVQVADAYERP